MKRLFCLFCFCALLFAGGLRASQNSLVVPDGTGAQVRSGFNNALDTLNTVNSGPGAPATTEAYMLWADTTNGLLKQRDATNSTWIILGSLGAAQMGHEPAISPGTTFQYWRGDKTWQTYAPMVYPGAGVPNSTGTAWGTSYSVGAGAGDLVQLNGSGQLPAVDGSQLTNLPTGGISKVASGSPAAAASFTITGLSPGVHYRLCLNLAQNTTAGYLSFNFNSDTGNNYKWTFIYGQTGGTGAGGGQAGVGAIYPFSTYATTAAAAIVVNDCEFSTVPGNNSAVKMTGNLETTYSGADFGAMFSGAYSGSSALSSLTVTTSAGTMTGAWTLYQYN